MDTEFKIFEGIADLNMELPECGTVYIVETKETFENGRDYKTFEIKFMEVKK